MASSSKRKGSRVEREIVRMHQDAGIVATKVPLSGALEGFPGDIVVADHFGGEVKARKNGAGFSTLERWLGDLDILFLKRDRQKPFVAMPWKTYELLMKAWGEQKDQP